MSDEDRRRFIPLCPDFLVELRSESDPLNPLREKMQEYIENGTRLGWLIDPYQGKVYVYRLDLPVEILDKPARVSGEPVLRGFTLNMEEVW